MKYFITGGAGFIGSGFIGYILDRYKDARVICIDKLTYAGNAANLDSFDKERFVFEYADICDRQRVFELVEEHRPDCIVNFAAESHVDLSIIDPMRFIETNIKGTANLLDAVKSFNIPRFHQVSTDEVYGDVDFPCQSRENDILLPSSPYSASKASADLLTLSYFRTFKAPVTISRCSNNYGPRQFPEKLIPLILYNISMGNPVDIYGKGDQSRDWLYVLDHCRALDMILNSGKEGEIYNIGGAKTQTNIETVEMLFETVGKRTDIRHVSDRPGHDRRYAVDISKISRELGWYPEYGLRKGMALTVDWYRNNQAWVDAIMNGSYIENNKKYITL